MKLVPRLLLGLTVIVLAPASFAQVGQAQGGNRKPPQQQGGKGQGGQEGGQRPDRPSAGAGSMVPGKGPGDGSGLDVPKMQGELVQQALGGGMQVETLAEFAGKRAVPDAASLEGLSKAVAAAFGKGAIEHSQLNGLLQRYREALAGHRPDPTTAARFTADLATAWGAVEEGSRTEILTAFAAALESGRSDSVTKALSKNQVERLAEVRAAFAKLPQKGVAAEQRTAAMQSLAQALRSRTLPPSPEFAACMGQLEKAWGEGRLETQAFLAFGEELAVLTGLPERGRPDEQALADYTANLGASFPGAPEVVKSMLDLAKTAWAMERPEGRKEGGRRGRGERGGDGGGGGDGGRR